MQRRWISLCASREGRLPQSTWGPSRNHSAKGRRNEHRGDWSVTRRKDAGSSSRAPDEALAKLSRFRLPKAEVVPTSLNQLLTVWKI